MDLIETVKAHPSLYDRQTGNFQDGRNRQFLWQSVGDEMKEKGHIIKGKRIEIDAYLGVKLSFLKLFLFINYCAVLGSTG